MKRSFMIAVVSFALATPLFGQRLELVSRPLLQNAVDTIKTELAGHGQRVLGEDAYSWHTRLLSFDDCRAEFAVQVTNNTGNPTVQVETVNLSLGALEPYAIQIQRYYLELPCAEEHNCIYSTTTCTRKADGILVDCSTPGQRRVNTFVLEFDGDAGSAQRMQLAFRQAAESCRQAAPAGF